MKKLDGINAINSIYVVMDSHTALHNSENLLTNLHKKYGEDRIKLSISIKDCTIPNSIKELLDKKEDATLLNIA